MEDNRGKVVQITCPKGPENAKDAARQREICDGLLKAKLARERVRADGTISFALRSPRRLLETPGDVVGFRFPFTLGETESSEGNK